LPLSSSLQLYPQKIVGQKEKEAKRKGVEMWKTLPSLPHSHTPNNNKLFINDFTLLI
jgi:hypothetical protein